MQQHGIEAVLRFSEVSELREALYRFNGIQSLLEVLAASTDTKMRRQVIQALGNFLEDEQQALYVLESQALKPIVRLIVASDPEVRMEALRMVSRAASVPELRQQLQSLGAVGPLVQLLNSNERQVRMAALYSVCVLSEDENVAVALSLADCGAQLLRVCENNVDDTDVLELAAETFGNLSRSSTGVAQLRECSAFSFLVRLVSSADRYAGPILEGAATALVQASTLPEGRLTIAALNGVSPLLKLCFCDDEVLRETVLWSCPNWCDGTTAESVLAVALPAIVTGLNDPKESVQSICVKTLLLLAASAENRLRLQKAKAKEALEKLERTTANPTLKLAATKGKAML